MTDILTIALLSAGFFFFFATSVGILRFPDFYNRMHAAGKGDTLSTLLMLGGLILYELSHGTADVVLTSIKILFIAVFIFFASPTATHAIIDAGYQHGLAPWTRDRKGEEDDMAV